MCITAETSLLFRAVLRFTVRVRGRVKMYGLVTWLLRRVKALTLTLTLTLSIILILPRTLSLKVVSAFRTGENELKLVGVVSLNFHASGYCTSLYFIILLSMIFNPNLSAPSALLLT